jgi:biopolymer transport protein ExbD
MQNGFGLVKGWGFGGGGGGHSAAGGGGHGTGLNLTPMIDLLTILLVFLIKNYSVNPYFLTPTQNIKLANTVSESVAPDKAVLLIGKDGIMIEGKLVVSFEGKKVEEVKFDEKKIAELKTGLETLANKTKFISEKNSQVQFTGTLILQADKDLPFEIMKPILKTAGIVGFNDIKFAGVYPD